MNTTTVSPFVHSSSVPNPFEKIKGEENKRLAKEAVMSFKKAVVLTLEDQNNLVTRGSADVVGGLASWAVSVGARYAVKWIGFKDGAIANNGDGITGFVGKNAALVNGVLGMALGVGAYVADGLMHKPEDMSWSRRAIQTGAIVSFFQGADSVLSPLLGIPRFA